MKSLRQLQRESLLSEIFRHEKRPKDANGNLQYCILVLDQTSQKILNSCFENWEITQEKIATFQMIEDCRPHQNSHAIYFVSPVSFTAQCFALVKILL